MTWCPLQSQGHLRLFLCDVARSSSPDRNNACMTVQASFAVGNITLPHTIVAWTYQCLCIFFFVVVSAMISALTHLNFIRMKTAPLLFSHSYEKHI